MDSVFRQKSVYITESDMSDYYENRPKSLYGSTRYDKYDFDFYGSLIMFKLVAGV